MDIKLTFIVNRDEYVIKVPEETSIDAVLSHLMKKEDVKINREDGIEALLKLPLNVSFKKLGIEGNSTIVIKTHTAQERIEVLSKRQAGK